MANTTTLLQLRTQARERADFENNDFVSDAELTSYINSSYSELYDLMVGAYEGYYRSSTEISTVANQADYTLPTDFYKAKGVDIKYGSNQYRLMERFNWNERNASTASGSRLDRIKYQIQGGNIRILPTPNTATTTIRLWYIPIFTRLVSDGDFVEANISNNGWDEYIIIDAARKMLEKEESNADHLLMQKANMVKRLEEMIANRDAEEEHTVKDVNDSNSRYDIYRGY